MLQVRGGGAGEILMILPYPNTNRISGVADLIVPHGIPHIALYRGSVRGVLFRGVKRGLKMSGSGKTLEGVGGFEIEDVTDLDIGADRVYVGATIEDILLDVDFAGIEYVSVG